MPKPAGSILRGPWTLRFAINGLLTASLGLMAVALISLGFMGWRQITLTTAADTVKKNAALVSLHMQSLLDPATTLLRTLSYYPMGFESDSSQPMDDLPLLVQDLKASSIVSAIFVGFDNGDFISLRSLADPGLVQQFEAPAGTEYLVQVVRNSGAVGQLKSTYYFIDAGLKTIASRDIAEEFDPRARPWYVKPGAGMQLHASVPYVFHSTYQVGISLSQRAVWGNAVVGLDLALQDLSTTLDRLKITPGTEVALLGADDKVIAYKGLAKWIEDNHQNLDGSVSLPNVEQLRTAALTSTQRDPSGQAVRFDIDGHDWLGYSLDLSQTSHPMRLLMAIPMQELLGDAYLAMRNMLLLAIAISLLALAWGWWISGKLSGQLAHLLAQARRMVHFDFARPESEASTIIEVAALQSAANNASKTVESFLSLGTILGKEQDTELMLQRVLAKCVQATGCESGAVYLWQPKDGLMQRAASFGANSPLDKNFVYPHRAIEPNAAAYLPVGGQQFAAEFELTGRAGELQGLLVLLHDAQRGDLYGPGFNAFVTRLSGMLAISIETRQLIEAQRQLFDGLIRMLADAVDAKSPYTGGHCKRVPELSLMIVRELQAQSSGKYADFQLSEQEHRAFSLAAWLHDCGKIISPEHIVDKASKLELIYNRIHEIRMRFEVLWRDAEIKYLKALSAGADPTAARDACRQEQQQLSDDFAFVAHANIGSETQSEQVQERLQQIAARTWLRNFDDLLGLAHEEFERRSAGRPAGQSLPVREALLADKPYHHIPWGAHKPAVSPDDPANTLGLNMDLPQLRQNAGELYNLSIRSGTLTPEDRFIINDHIVQTLLMLDKLPWPRGFEDVPDIAANHHERMDGNGYPRRLQAGELPVTHRVIALADVFEALTAADRPYKVAKTVSESLAIMANMCVRGHLDEDLFRYFLHSDIWLEYAQRYLNPAQIDAVELGQIEALLDGGRQA